jgi:hypothetical protein
MRCTDAMHAALQAPLQPPRACIAPCSTRQHASRDSEGRTPDAIVRGAAWATRAPGRCGSHEQLAPWRCDGCDRRTADRYVRQAERQEVVCRSGGPGDDLTKHAGVEMVAGNAKDLEAGAVETPLLHDTGGVACTGSQPRCGADGS